MKIIGITGGIGCGKSYVARKMALRGIPVYDTDSNARRLMLQDQSIREGISALVPGAYASGELDRRLIAGFLFASEENARKIDSIVHPAVFADFRRWVRQQDGDFCAVESAILFECGLDRETNAVVVVHAPMELRIDRCMKRDGTTRDKITERINQQMDQAEKCSKADFVIMNDDTSDIDSQIDSILENLK